MAMSFLYQPKNIKRLRIASILSLILIVLTISICGYLKYKQMTDTKEAKAAFASMQEAGKGRIINKLLKPNQFSRSKRELKKVKGVVVHYTANPGASAIANRNYFNNLPKINKRTGKNTYASSNYIIGIDGQILRVVPENEMAYASNDRNKDTLSIECCHPSKDGAFTKETYDSLVWLVARICEVYHLKSDDIIRHHDVTGKMCPKYYVEHPDKWKLFKKDVDNARLQIK